MLALLVDHARLRLLERRFDVAGLQGSCLYEGRSAQELLDVAPFLYAHPSAHGDGDGVVHAAWGALRGTESAILVRSSATAAELRRHFRTLTVAMDENGAFLLFRFYDPRVLRLFLPLADAAQRSALFGPVDAFVVDDPVTGEARELAAHAGAEDAH